MDLIKRLVKLLIPFAIAAVVVNDAGRYFTATYDLGNVSRDAAAASAAAARGNQDRTASWQAGEQLAEASGATVYGYDIKGGQVYVWTRSQVKGTWVLQRLTALLDRKPSTTPLLIEDQAQAVVP